MREVGNQQQGLYRPEFEHDNCGIGAVVNIKGKKTHDTVANALKIVENLEHRAGKSLSKCRAGKLGLSHCLFCMNYTVSFIRKIDSRTGSEVK